MLIFNRIGDTISTDSLLTPHPMRREARVQLNFDTGFRCLPTYPISNEIQLHRLFVDVLL